MAANFNLPTVDTTYTAFPTQIIENIDAALQQLSVGSPSNVPTNAIKWDSSANRWKKYNGSAYVDLTGTYDLNAQVSVNQLNLGDDEAVRLGNSQDLQLFHRSSDGVSLLKELGGGYLSIQSNGSKVEIYDSANNRTMAQFNTDGACTFNHGATTRLQTTSGGATITGNLTANGTEHKFSSETSGDCTLIIEADTDDNNENDTPKILLRQDGGNDWSAVGTSSDNILELSNSVSFGGGISFKTGTTDGYTNATERMKIFGSGEVDIAAGLRVLSNGNCGIGLTNPAYKLHIYSGSADALAVKSTVSGANILLISDDTQTKFQSVDGDLFIEADVQNNVAGSQIKFLIDNDTKYTIDSSGVITANKTGTNIGFKAPDNAMFIAGTNNDLQIFHNSNNSIINDNGTGELQLQRGGNAILSLNSFGVNITDPNGEAICQVTGFEGFNASVQLVADEGDNNGDRWKLVSVASDNTFRLLNNVSGSNVTKWTISTGGDVNQTGHLDLPDDKSLRLGSSDDLQLFHRSSDGSSLIAETGGGYLSLQSNGNRIELYDSANNRNMAEFFTGGACKFKNGATTRLETTSTGATVTGNFIANGTEHKFSSGTSGDCELVLEADTDNNNENDTPRMVFRQDGGNDWSAIGMDNNVLAISNSVSSGGGIIFKLGSTNGYTNAVEKWKIESDGDVVQTGNLYIENTFPIIQLKDTNNDSDYQIRNDNGSLHIRDITNSVSRFSVTSGGSVTVANSNSALANDDGDDLIVGTTSGARGITIVSQNNQTGNLFFSDGTASNQYHQGAIVYSHSNDEMKFMTNGYNERLKISSSGDLSISSGRILIANGAYDSPAFSFINSNTTGFYRLSSNQIGVSCNGEAKYKFTPNQFGVLSDDELDLGSGNFRFDNIHATNNVIQTSDKNSKNTIATSDLGLDFINKLNPVSYKYNGKTRTHYGLIAQEIEAVLGAISKPATDFGGFCKDEVDEDGNAITPIYGLRYTEFISPIIKAIQELSAKVAALESA